MGSPPQCSPQDVGPPSVHDRFVSISALSMDDLKETAEVLDIQVDGTGKRGRRLRRDYIRQIEREMRRTGTMII